MKHVIKQKILILACAMMVFCLSANKIIAQNRAAVSVNYQNFYDDLSPYGTWIYYPAYGHVWRPDITGEFRPYLTNGYWDYSADGWMWMSNYNWGWAPFHYGRWVYDDSYGWLWVPGYEWSPAWVTWGMVDNNYAWAPLMPGVNVSVAFGVWKPSPFYWNVVPRDHIYDRDIFRRVQHRDFSTTNVQRINIINNFNTTQLHGQYYAKGPDVTEVEKYTNRKIEAASIRNINDKAVATHLGHEIQVYRPTVTNPQPHEFKTINKDNSNPVDEVTGTPAIQQKQNLDQLPARKAPAEIFGGRQGGFSEGRRVNTGGRNKRH